MVSSTLFDENPLNEETEFYLKYEPAEILGDGLSSVVRRCIHKESGKDFAVKIIDKFSKRGEDVKGIDIITQVRTEVNALSKLRQHPNIITLIDVYESSAFMFLVFELARGGELFDHLTKRVTLEERVTRKIMWQLLQAVKYMHGLNIVHRDLKPENILLDDDSNILLSDFGFAVELQEPQRLYDVLGTPAYFAPETLNCVISDAPSGYGKPVDLWACGVIMYTLLAGQGPFWHRKDTMMYRKIMEGKYGFNTPEWDDQSELSKNLIEKLLVVDSADRITAERALSHIWFQGMVACPKCTVMRNDVSKKRKLIKLKTLVFTIIVIKHLYYTFHERFKPVTFKDVVNEPYNVKDIRKIIDNSAFSIYGHWVKKSQDQVQNRAALFANSVKREILADDCVDGTTVSVPDMYSSKLTRSFLPKRPSFTKRRSSASDNNDSIYDVTTSSI